MSNTTSLQCRCLFFMLFGLFLEGDSKSHNLCLLRWIILASNSQYQSRLWFFYPSSHPHCFLLLFSRTSSLTPPSLLFGSGCWCHCCCAPREVYLLLRSLSQFTLPRNTDQKTSRVSSLVLTERRRVCFPRQPRALEKNRSDSLYRTSVNMYEACRSRWRWWKATLQQKPCRPPPASQSRPPPPP